jgi:hypothetical protein
MNIHRALRVGLLAGIVSIFAFGAAQAKVSAKDYLSQTYQGGFTSSYTTSYGVSFDSKGDAFFNKSTTSNSGGGKPSSLAFGNSGKLYVVSSDKNNNYSFTPAVTSSVYVSDYETKSTTEYCCFGGSSADCCYNPCCPPPPCGWYPPPYGPPPSCGGSDPSAVPEPSTYAMLFLGLGMVAFLNRRRLVPIKI